MEFLELLTQPSLVLNYLFILVSVGMGFMGIVWTFNSFVWFWKLAPMTSPDSPYHAQLDVAKLLDAAGGES